jgi:DNA helicase-2/ATP-dependent DNA helicase PcrA
MKRWRCWRTRIADPEQRIFEFAGAEAKRLQQYRDTFHPTEFDLASSNHRSKGTDIATFGNDILTGEFRQNIYAGVSYFVFEPNQNQALVALHGQALKARKRLVDRGRRKWTLAVLVPTKKFTRLVSDAFRSPLGNMPPIAHSATIDMEGVVLAAEFLAFLLQQEAGTHAQKRAVDLICAFYRGRDGDVLHKGNAKEADSIESAHAKCVAREAAGKSPPAKSIYNAIRVTLDSTRDIKLTGDPDTDWITLRTALEKSNCPRLKEISAELRNLRLFERGTQIRQALTSDWRENSSYPNALQITRQAFVREHFASAARPEQGVIVMNMHKAKGKQFDEVIIFEGWPKRQGGLVVANSDRIVRNNERSDDMTQARQNFRVSVTRARQQTTILTPKNDPCVLLTSKKQST